MSATGRTAYWRDVAERAIRSAAQGVLAALGVGTATFDPGGLPWLDALYIGAVSAALSVLMSMAGRKIGDPKTGSWQPSPNLSSRVIPI